MSGRNSDGTFGKGNTVSKGPRRSIGKIVKKAVSDEDLQEIIAALVTKAKDGDVQAASTLLSRVWPTYRAAAAPIFIDGFDGENPEKALKDIIKSAASGESPVDVASQLISASASVASVTEISALRQEIADVQERLKLRSV